MQRNKKESAARRLAMRFAMMREEMHEEWLQEGKPVKGHLCAGLRALQKAGGGCVPDINANGTMRGCDDEQEIAILFCPMCGAALEDKLSQSDD